MGACDAIAFDTVARDAAAERLAVLGAFHDGDGTLILLGPAEPGYWAHLTAQPEWHDGAPDPIDRWSARVIGALAARHGAEALFPFGGPPWHPFYQWALKSGRAWASPVQLLVHDTAGLMVSYRGALRVPARLALPAPPSVPPCKGCAAPCASACPAGALTPRGYDVPACHAFLDRPEGGACRQRGCAVRRACPVSATSGRLEVQSAYHMGEFHRCPSA
ncbi:ferredoxin [Acidimangrovimonas sediminis]|uniref:ferredoxin n=1 Tax=Acidimangrovimonas sediminis TaxID=2056283 RepID=UPI001E36B98E|nr:ferredoxin [Acidimangrovimonas sediminis]